MRRAVYVAVALAIAAACANADVYVYTARKYDAAGACLDPYSPVDLINGGGVGSTCLPTCFEFGGDVYTSTVCPPLPTDAVELDAASPECVAASSLFDATCGTFEAGADASDANTNRAGGDVPPALDAGDTDD